MNTALLSRTDAYGLSVLNVANRVALSVLQGYKRYLQIADRLRSECLVLGRDVLEELRVVEVDLVTPLFEGDAEDLLVFYRVRAILWVNLYDTVVAALFLLQDFKSLRLVSGAMTPSLTSRLMSFAVATSTVSLRAQKSP